MVHWGVLKDVILSWIDSSSGHLKIYPFKLAR
jgi:hypothetical protein